MPAPASSLTDPVYTKRQLVQAAIEQGHRGTKERLFTDWQQAGLIDQPGLKKGLGRGKGVVALWPASQLHLWLLLLNKRKETSQIPNLCNVPVGLWLYFGDDYATLRQVRKCMTTWAQRYGSSRGHTMAKQTARRLIEDLALAGMSRDSQADLVSRLAGALLTGITDDEQRRSLRDALIRSIPAAIRNPVGATKAEAVVDVVLLRVLAAHRLARGDVPSHIFEWARAWHLFGLRRYMDALQTGELPPISGMHFETPDFEVLVPNSCRDLISSIGMALSLAQDDQVSAPVFHPDSWKNGAGKLSLSFDIQPSPIIRPNGRQHAKLQIQVAAQVNTGESPSSVRS